MAINRFFPLEDSSDNSALTAQLCAFGQTAVPLPALFIPVMPGAVMPGIVQWQQVVLQMAYQLARVIVAPPRHELLITSSWN